MIKNDEWVHGITIFPKYGGVVKVIRGRRPDDMSPIRVEVFLYPIIETVEK